MGKGAKCNWISKKGRGSDLDVKENLQDLLIWVARADVR